MKRLPQILDSVLLCGRPTAKTDLGTRALVLFAAVIRGAGW
ncbi:MAG: hypothetical protein V1800_10190 [Candidatus Latescibacterota bacterium]